ncbi:Appr-1-p processing domain protein [Filobasidium floriforme]|uniref:Appr-1-p processing domain protein n=1 Tax=Filobasidium floriforme TaxID=5210 RepID=UPI001E8D9C26|nr:Appr-1-p processing domain protein [Filobasidium floriforme]KAH8084161.1 Appr-1-p processing domain protein [Filobasidium floriforme]
MAGRIKLHTGDITQLKVDMIVNAANNSLLGGGGVDGAIHRAAGPELLKACRPLRGCDTGDAKVTPGFELPAKFVAHTVGPVYNSSRAEACARQLASCYSRCLELLLENGGGEIAFPSISCGVYGYPHEAATEIAVKTIKKGLDNDKDGNIKGVTFVQFDSAMQDVYEKVVRRHFPDYA